MALARGYSFSECVTIKDGRYVFDVEKYFVIDSSKHELIQFYKSDIESFLNDNVKNKSKNEIDKGKMNSLMLRIKSSIYDYYKYFSNNNRDISDVLVAEDWGSPYLRIE